jgi:hypothetical protein
MRSGLAAGGQEISSDAVVIQSSPRLPLLL